MVILQLLLVLLCLIWISAIISGYIWFAMDATSGLIKSKREVYMRLLIEPIFFPVLVPYEIFMWFKNLPEKEEQDERN